MKRGRPLDSLRRWKNEQYFNPGFLGWLVNPFFFARRGLRAGLAEYLPAFSGEVLDVGCGRKPYQALTNATRYIGVDIDTQTTRTLAVADIFYDGRKLPFPDASFDGVICSQVLEHVFTPGIFLAEISRVLRPGGKLLLATPLVWDEHEQPFDFARYSSFGLRDLLEKSGFQLVAQRKTCADFRVIVQLASAFIYKVTLHRRRWRNRLVQLFIIAPVNLTGALLAKLLPRNQDLYLDNIVFARKTG